VPAEHRSLPCVVFFKFRRCKARYVRVFGSNGRRLLAKTGRLVLCRAGAGAGDDSSDSDDNEPLSSLPSRAASASDVVGQPSPQTKRVRR
jgi:hypothetical protein